MSVKTLVAISAFALSVIGYPAVSRADVVIDFFQGAGCDTGLGCASSGLMADATIKDVSGGVQLTFHLDDATNFQFFQAGNPPMIVFEPGATNTDGSTISGATPTSIGGSAVSWIYDPNNPPYNGIGVTGKWPHGLGYTPGHNNPFTNDIVLTLTGLTANDFLTGNGSGYLMAIDMCHLGTNGSCSGTGFAGGTLATVPLPSAALLFGSALAGLGTLGLRRRRRRIA